MILRSELSAKGDTSVVAKKSIETSHADNDF